MSNFLNNQVTKAINLNKYNRSLINNFKPLTIHFLAQIQLVILLQQILDLPLFVMNYFPYIVIFLS